MREQCEALVASVVLIERNRKFVDSPQRTVTGAAKGGVLLDHVSVGVSDIDRSRRFYDATLRPLGLLRIVAFGDDRGSDYGAGPGPLGVEFTITRQ